MALCIGENFSEELTCAVCLDSWKNPTELVPCGHIYCRECLTGMKACPTCRVEIKSTTTPNRAIVNMALNVKVKCAKCGWKGTREQSASHTCGSQAKRPDASATKNPLPPSTAPAQPQNLPPSHYNQPPPPQSQPQPTQPYTYNFDQVIPQANSSNANFGQAPSGVYFTGLPAQQPPQSAAVPYQMPQPQNPPQRQNTGGRRYEVIEPTGRYPWNQYGLTQDEYDQIVSIFVFFDSDDSGTLDRQEVARLAHWLNFARTDAEVNRIFMDMDSNGNGALSLGEFLTWLKYNKPNPQSLYGLNQKQYNTIMMQFHTYDSNQDGSLEFEEFCRLVLNLGDVPNRDAAFRLFRMIDNKNTGSIDLHRFLTFRAGKSL